MAQEIIDKYTRSLYNIVNIDEIDIFHDVTWGFPDYVDTDRIEEMFINHYMFYEIGVETISKFLFKLKAKIDELHDKYANIFYAFKDAFTNDDIYSNNMGEFDSSNKRYATPQTQIGQVSDYLTEQVDNHGSESYLRGVLKAEAREEFIKRIRNVYLDYISEFRNLFMMIY